MNKKVIIYNGNDSMGYNEFDNHKFVRLIEKQIEEARETGKTIMITIEDVHHLEIE